MKDSETNKLNLDVPVPAGAGPIISDREFTTISEFIYKTVGIDIKPHKKGLIQNRLAKQIRTGGFNSFQDYFDFVRSESSGAEVTLLIDAISTNVTNFFRENQHFEYIKEKILPGLAAHKRQKGERKIRIWSSACSSGEEPYTIALTFIEHFKEINDFDFMILASDISTRVLAMAEKGQYSEEKLKDVPRPFQLRYFDKIQSKTGHLYQVKDSVKKRIMFRRMNLMAPDFPFTSPIDIIFCRNVMIYFDKPTQTTLIGKFFRHLVPGGHMFLGHSEGLTGVEHGFKYVLPSIYQKPV